MGIARWFYERWYKASTDETLVRCSCWRHLHDGVAAPNNGWFRQEAYPHATYCENPDR